MLDIPRRIKQTILTTLALSGSLVATPVLAEEVIVVEADLISFRREQTANNAQSHTPLYTLKSAEGFVCKDFEEGKTTNSLTFTDNSLQKSQCQLGEGLGSGNPSDWDSTIILTWNSQIPASKYGTGVWLWDFSVKICGVPFVR